MKRLIQSMGLNSPEEYDRIFDQRDQKEADPADVRRWKRLLKYYKGGRLIDLGCLDSEVPTLAQNWHPMAQVWGIDTAPIAIQKMQERYPSVIYKVQDVYHTQFPSNYFRYAVAGELIEHLDDPHAFVKETVRILARKGVLAISTPLDEEKEVGAVDGERHLWSFSEQDLLDMLSPYGEVRIKYLTSQWFPYYHYQWPTLLAYLIKS